MRPLGCREGPKVQGFLEREVQAVWMGMGSVEVLCALVSPPTLCVWESVDHQAVLTPGRHPSVHVALGGSGQVARDALQPGQGLRVPGSHLSAASSAGLRA